MKRIESLADDRMGPDGSHPDEGERRGEGKDGGGLPGNAQPARGIQGDQRENPGADRRAEPREEVDFPRTIAEREDVAEETGKDCPERIPRGVHHPEVKRGSRHLPIVIKADVRHDGRPVGDEGDQEGKNGNPAFVGVEYPERMDPFLSLGV